MLRAEVWAWDPAEKARRRPVRGARPPAAKAVPGLGPGGGGGVSKLVRRAGVRHSKIRDMGKRGCHSGPQPSDAACLQGRPQALGWLRGAAVRDEPWEGDRLCSSPVGAGLRGSPWGGTSREARPGRRPPATPCALINHCVLPHLESSCKEGHEAPPGTPTAPKACADFRAPGRRWEPLPKPRSQGFPPGRQSQPSMR